MADHDRQVQRRNFWANVGDGALFALALGIVSQQTVLPVFVKRLGGGNVAIGLIPVLWTLGFNFPQILSARYVQQFLRKKPIFLRTSFIQRAPWVLLSLLAFVVVDVIPSGAAVTLFLFLFGLSAVAGSVNFPIWFDLLAKLTPIERRGRLFATRNFFGGILGVLGGFIVERVLSSVAYPSSFGLLFLIAVLAMSGSYGFLLRLKEDIDSRVVLPIPLREYIRSLRRILRQDRRLRNFLISDAFMTAATAGGAFFTVSAMERFALPDSYAGTFTIVITAATIAGNLFFGVVADRRGHRVNMLLAAGGTAVACTLALGAASVVHFYIVFAVSALAVSLAGISRIAFVAELCAEEDRPTYIALANMLTSPFVLFGVLGGWMANVWNFEAVFGVAAVCAGLSFVGWYWWIEEPRSRTRRDPSAVAA